MSTRTFPPVVVTALALTFAATAFATTAFAGAALAADRPDPTERTIHVPEGWEGAYELGYAPAVRVGNQVIVSGIPAGGEGTYEEKVRRMYERAVQVLAAAGATLDDVVELTTFHVQPQDSAAFRAELGRYMPIHREFFGDHRPAWTAVGTTALLSATAVVEMRLVAVVGSGDNSRVVRGGAAADDSPTAEPAAETPSEAPQEPH